MHTVKGAIMTIKEQFDLAVKVKPFLKKWGLKQAFLAGVCEIHETTMSHFVNGKGVLSAPKYAKLASFMEEYDARNDKGKAAPATRMHRRARKKLHIKRGHLHDIS